MALDQPKEVQLLLIWIGPVFAAVLTSSSLILRERKLS